MGSTTTLYHWEFLAHVETLETYGGMGVVPVVPTFLSTKIRDLAEAKLTANDMHPTDQECSLAVLAVLDEYLATLMLIGANGERFSELQTDLKNQYEYGDDH